jgi:hypothetical protein
MRKSSFLLLLSTASIALSVIFMAACHKSSTTAEDMGYTTDQSTAEKSFEDAQTAADQASTTPTGSMNFRTTATTSSPCATVTHSVTTTAPYAGDSVIIIDFGTSDCLCNDLSYRRGQIIIYYSGLYAATGSTHTITFNNFYQNDNQVTGTKTVTNMGTNGSGQIYFDVTINGSVILANGAGTVSAVWNRVRTWITQGSPNVYEISGSGTLTRANGTTVGVNIPTATPLVVASNCRYIEAGTVVYTLPSGLTRSLNYGNTAVCDDEAVLTLPNGKTYPITLR